MAASRDAVGPRREGREGPPCGSRGGSFPRLHPSAPPVGIGGTRSTPTGGLGRGCAAAAASTASPPHGCHAPPHQAAGRSYLLVPPRLPPLTPAWRLAPSRLVAANRRRWDPAGYRSRRLVAAVVLPKRVADHPLCRRCCWPLQRSSPPPSLVYLTVEQVRRRRWLSRAAEPCARSLGAGESVVRQRFRRRPAEGLCGRGGSRGGGSCRVAQRKPVVWCGGCYATVRRHTFGWFRRLSWRAAAAAGVAGVHWRRGHRPSNCTTGNVQLRCRLGRGGSSCAPSSRSPTTTHA